MMTTKSYVIIGLVVLASLVIFSVVSTKWNAKKATPPEPPPVEEA